MIDLWTLKQWCLDNTVPCISSPTEYFFLTFIEKNKPQTICEIGSAVGYSGLLFASLLQEWNGQIWSIEHSFPNYQLACHNARLHKLYNITFYHSNAGEVDYQKLCGQKMDFIYIDAKKSDYLAYFKRVINIVAPHTTIIFDDVIKFAHKTSSLYEYFDKNQIKYTVHQLDEDDGIMVLENVGLQLANLWISL